MCMMRGDRGGIDEHLSLRVETQRLENPEGIRQRRPTRCIAAAARPHGARERSEARTGQGAQNDLNDEQN